MKPQAGVFVSLHRGGSLRGCIGTFGPTTDNVAQEVVRNAIEAATRDPRFPPMQSDELAGLEISVDVLSDPVPAKSERELDAKKYGVIKGGMIPKVNCGIHALKKGVDQVHIVNGQIPHVLLLELFTDHGVGTMVVK